MLFDKWKNKEGYLRIGNLTGAEEAKHKGGSTGLLSKEKIVFRFYK